MKQHYAFSQFVAAVVAVSSFCTTASAFEPQSDKLYGFVPATSNYYMTANNFYSFDKAAPSAGTKLGNTALMSYKPSLAGAFLDNGEYIGVGKQSDYSTTKVIMRLSLGSDNYWNMSKNVTVTYSNVTAMTNDNGTLYMWYQASLGDSFRLATVNPDDLTVANVGTNGSSTTIIAMTAGNGTLYGIDTSGKLYTISKTDGQLTEVGSTGKSTVSKSQSACFDSESGMILWARYDDSSYYSKVSEIVTVNPSTGAASTKGTLTYSPQVVGLYTPVSISSDAPGEVIGLAATNDGTDNNITVAFTMPTKNYGGTDFNPNLQGLSYTISVDGTKVIENKASSIGAVVSEVIPSTPGTHTVSVFASQTSYGDGPESKTSLFVGMDTPGAPKNVKASAIDTNITVTWEAPEGQNGGRYDNTKLAYNVIRMPGEVKAAENLTGTTFSETVQTDKLQAYTYKVITVYDGQEGLSTESASVFAGPSFEVTRTTPYTQDFQTCATADDSGFFLTGKSAASYASDPVLKIQTENDNKYLQVVPDESYARVNNPKVFTTALKLKARHTYRLSFKFRTSNTYGASFSVYLSDKPTADCQNIKTIIAEKSYGYPDDHKTEFTDDRVTPAEFQVDETGVYFVSVQHGYLSATWDFDDVKVEDITEPGIPSTPTDLTAEAAENSRDVKLSFTLPSEDNNGDNPELTGVEIKRDDQALITLTENLQAGASMTWTDENAPLGTHTYSVTAINANGSSAAAQTSVKVGRDHDLAITDVKAPESVVKGRSFSVTATVHNNGINAAPLGEDEYILALVQNLAGGATQVIESRNGVKLDSDGSMEYTFEVPVAATTNAETLSYYFYLTYETDQNIENNRSADFSIDVITPGMPAPTGLTAVWNGAGYDLTWTAPEYDAETVELKGYNVYANYEKLNGDTPVTETAYKMEAELDKEYTIYVVAVYDLGESEDSEECIVSTSGIAGVGAAGFSVRVEGDMLHVLGTEGQVSVYSIAGHCMGTEQSLGGNASFRLAKGSYIVKAAGKCVKVMI